MSILAYLPRNSPIHRLTGATKLTFMLLWMVTVMATFDTRVIVAMLALAIPIFIISKIKLRDIWFMLCFTGVFLLLNNVFIYMFMPEEGVAIYGTRHLLFEIMGRYTITAEQLFYQLNVTLKYIASVPMAILFISTTNPSEFAASLNRIGVSYKIGYAVALALRYIPDIQRDFHDISQAQQARGIEMSAKVNIIARLKNASTIIFPLILSSFERIEVITNAMELRGFGKHKKRTWYSGRAFTVKDYCVLIFGAVLFGASIIITFWDGNRFYNPFI